MKSMIVTKVIGVLGVWYLSDGSGLISRSQHITFSVTTAINEMELNLAVIENYLYCTS